MEDVEEKYPEPWVRFLMVESADHSNPFSNMCPFVGKWGFEEISRSIERAKIIRGGKYLVDCPTERVSNNVLNRIEALFVDRKILVVVHEKKAK